ncbi:MAG: 4-hydroxy-3-methylbut-2-enyl diphosphate reductase [Proteobacteria bacterium]|nr:4-hydroxy-3-methylbut-2-enyl diphosphate reductase [Pseudomonadota bacterium]MDA1059655.1 4-hydroxy-3-methylbut-2-enyl diphosphate reductase [Pseudomonadota bacterium]
MSLTPLTVLMASPRGFCAGVDRAILIVERALERFGPPVYVRHHIVHNARVVADLERAGAIFVSELDEVPKDAPVIFSAHGVARAVVDEAQDRHMTFIDATCPLVHKVHNEAKRQHDNGRHVVLIGHAGHPEVIGTMGQLPDGAMTLVETVAEAQTATIPAHAPLAYATQTTLSVDETAEIIAALRVRFPDIAGPPREDICYATTNRQEAVRSMAPDCDYFLVLGAPSSSNSRRLVETAQRAGCSNAKLIEDAGEIDWDALIDVKCLGISAGASAPEILVTEVLHTLERRFDLTVRNVSGVSENVTFNLPRMLEA